MGKIITTLIDRFDGGLTSQIRSKKRNESSLIANFDIFSDPNRIFPHRDLDDETFTGGTPTFTAANIKLCRYLAATNASQNATLLYGLGVVNGQIYAKIFSRTMPNTAWAEVHVSDAEDTVDRDENVFVEYKNVIYGWSRVNGTNARIWAYHITTPAFTSTAKSLTEATTVVQGLVHSKFDILFLAYNNIIIKKDNADGSTVTTGWTAPALTLPSNQVITSICEYGSYLAIAVKPKIAGGQSIVYLWDMDSTLEDLSEKINWGNEELELIEEINGHLIGISVLSNFSTFVYAGTVTSPRLLIKDYAGSLAGTTIVKEILIEGDVLISGKQKANNLLYFMMGATIRSVHYDAIWTFGISESGVWALTIDRLLNNGTAITTPRPKGFAIMGDRIFVAYTGDGTYIAERTTASGNPWANANSIYETLIINDGDSSITKKLLGVEVFFEPLPSAGNVILEYKINENINGTTWVKVFDFDTDDAISHGSINIESSGITLPEYKEIMYRVSSKGNAKITGFKWKSEVIGKTLF